LSGARAHDGSGCQEKGDTPLLRWAAKHLGGRSSLLPSPFSYRGVVVVVVLLPLPPMPVVPAHDGADGAHGDRMLLHIPSSLRRYAEQVFFTSLNAKPELIDRQVPASADMN
jgi:hypothetical protein